MLLYALWPHLNSMLPKMMDIIACKLDKLCLRFDVDILSSFRF